MNKPTRIFVSLACVATLCGYARLSFGQAPSLPSVSTLLTVPVGTPLHISLTQKVPVKHAGIPVEGLVVDNVYVFDHLVIPAGSRVLGNVATVESAPRKQRALAIANGNFTPLRQAHVDFNTLVGADGKHILLQTTVSQGSPALVHVTAGQGAKKQKGKIAGKVDEIHEEVKSQEQAAIDNVTAPGKMQRIKSELSARLPYHPPSMPVGTSFTAELKTPLAFGAETHTPQQLEKLGGPIPPGSLVHIRLLTPLSSASDQRDTAVRAVLSQPLFSLDHSLILPEGAHLNGSVIEAVPARRFGRNGQLRFTFSQLEVSSGAVRKVEASLQGIDAASESHLQLDTEGGAHAVTPKSSYVMPAIDIFLATTSIDLDAGHHALHPNAIHGPDYSGAGIRGAAGLGLAGAVVSLLAHSRPVSAGFAFYGAGWSVYSHFVARGADVIFPRNTPMEIRFGTHEENPSGGRGKRLTPASTESGKTT